ncbi:MAG: hypothetical protein R3F49_16135, partial [Planctomycetota bacterium]
MSLEKRLPLALLLSFVVLFGWSWLQGPPAKPNPDGGAVPASGDPANGGPANADPANGDPAIGLGGAPEAESGPVAPGAAPESVPANMAEDGDAALQAAGAA